MKFRVIIEQDEDGVFVAQCPSLPGCISQGKTREEAQANIKEAITGYLKNLEKHGEPIPPPITEEIVEVFDILKLKLYRLDDPLFF
ncbi:MAG: type II toxin-antitoxin system HicB family antitoxin [Thermodesulfobacteriota bacterium]